jgi:hypothetical protein
VFPALEAEDVELGRLDELAAAYPMFGAEIRSFGAGAPSGSSD